VLASQMWLATETHFCRQRVIPHSEFSKRMDFCTIQVYRSGLINSGGHTPLIMVVQMIMTVSLNHVQPVSIVIKLIKTKNSYNSFPLYHHTYDLEISNATLQRKILLIFLTGKRGLGSQTRGN